MILYDRPTSSNALKVRFLLAELEIAYESRVIPPERPRPAWFRAINPLGLVPTLDDNGFVLTESHAILRYLAATARRDDLFPDDLHGRARIDEFLDRWATTIRPAFHRVEQPALGLGGAEIDESAAAREGSRIGPALELLSALIDGETVLGTLTIADFAVAPVLFRAANLPIDLAPFPKVRRLREALVTRPSFLAAGPVR